MVKKKDTMEFAQYFDVKNWCYPPDAKLQRFTEPVSVYNCLVYQTSEEPATKDLFYFVNKTFVKAITRAPSLARAHFVLHSSRYPS